MSESGTVIPGGLYLYMIFGYLLLAMGLSVFWVRKSEADNKLELIILIFWLLTGSYYELIIKKAPGLGFLESRPFWLYLLVFAFFLIRRAIRTGLKRWRNPAWRGSWPAWEVALYVLVSFQTLSNLYYLNDLGMNDFIRRFGDNLFPVVIILAMIELTSRKSLPLIRNAVLVGAAVSTFIGLIQLVGDPLFMRYADLRSAFGSYFRAAGIFTREYYHSYFVLGALIWTLITVTNRTIQNILIGIFVLGVVITFHRMSYLIMMFIFTIYYLFVRRPSGIKVATTGVAMATLVLLGVLLFGQTVLESQVYKDRFSDNVEGRKGYWQIVMKTFPDRPVFGYGGTDNEVYYVNMLRHTRNRDRASGDSGDIHNGYFQILFVHGLPAALAFGFYILLAMVYYGRLSSLHPFFFIPLMFGLLYFTANMTNNFSLVKYTAHLAAFYFGLGLGARYVEDPSELPDTNSTFQQNFS